MRRSAIALCLLCLTACHREPARTAPGLKAGISSVRLGMSAQEVMARIGEPLSLFPDKDDPKRSWALYAWAGQLTWIWSRGYTSLRPVSPSAILQYRGDHLVVAALVVGGFQTQECACRKETGCAEGWADKCAAELP